MERLSFDKPRQKPDRKLPAVARFQQVSRCVPDNDDVTPEGDIRTAYYLSYQESNCDYLELTGTLKDALDAGQEVVSAGFIIPYPPGFPILVPGQVISQEILAFMLALDVNEIHGYRADLGSACLYARGLGRLAQGQKP